MTLWFALVNSRKPTCKSLEQGWLNCNTDVAGFFLIMTAQQTLSVALL